MLNKGELKIIGVILCSAQDESNAKYLNGIAEHAKKNGYRLMIFNSFLDFSYDDRPEQPMKSVFRMINFDILDGIILLTETLKSPDIISGVMFQANQRKIPVVSFVTPVEGAYSIRFDYEENFHRIIRHVIEKHGCRRIFFVAGIQGNSFSNERLACYREEMEQHGLPVDERWIGYGDFWEEPTYALMDRWLTDETLERPEAIICANDSMALAACIKLEEYGLRVPNDVLVTGHDGITAERYHTPRLTTAVTDYAEAARRAVEVFTELAAGREPPKEIVVQSELVLSESCGCKKVQQKAVNRKISTLFSDMTRQIMQEDQLNAMAVKLGRANDFDGFRELLSKYIELSWAGRAWICMPQSAYTPRHLTADELADDSTNQQPETKFYEGSKLNNVFSWVWGSEYIPCDVEFDRTEILPNLIDKLREFDNIFFAPISFRDLSQGYIGFSTALQNPQLKFISMFMSYLNMTFEMVMQKSFNSAAVSQLKSMYMQDFMTTLYNRRGFYTRIRSQLERCVSLRQDLIVVSVDMDGLKKINDTYGHNEGDAAIKALAKLLRQSAEDDAVVARFGGDEFVVAAVCPDGEQRAAQFQEKLTRKIEAYNEISGKLYQISASVGVSVTKPEKGEGIDRLIEAADDMMYSQKAKHHKQTRGG